ncbi:MAG: orotidine 5'-phosphate decarboxylase [Oscillospiraceae bacterium]|nr:orotidine 5'-phosphate decarboxylase [Oscillospiraceae bacterium]
MKLQTAIDRVSLEQMLELGQGLCGHTDLVEVGTSLIKEYGIAASVGAMRRSFPNMTILADIKTCDEGAYEFQKAYEAGADVATVMGFSTDATIRACAEVAEAFGKDWFIDLMELPEEAVYRVAMNWPNAIFGVHLSFDQQGAGLRALVSRSTQIIHAAEATDGKLRRIAVAGGVKLDVLPELKLCGVDTVIVGSAITKATEISQAAEAFFRACHKTT